MYALYGSVCWYAYWILTKLYCCAAGYLHGSLAFWLLQAIALLRVSALLDSEGWVVDAVVDELTGSARVWRQHSSQYMYSGGIHMNMHVNTHTNTHMCMRGILWKSMRIYLGVCFHSVGHGYRRVTKITSLRRMGKCSTTLQGLCDWLSTFIYMKIK